MNGIISDRNLEIDNKIREKITPTHDDKKKLQHRVKQLTKSQHLHLFNNLIKNLDISYTITDNGTYFDLNDMNPEQFWKLYYHINLSFDCINRNKIMDELERQCNSTSLLYKNDMDLESNSVFNELCDNDDLNVESLMDYPKLRQSALNFAKYELDPTSTSDQLTNNESKVIEKNIYTDKKFLHKAKY